MSNKTHFAVPTMSIHIPCSLHGWIVECVDRTVSLCCHALRSRLSESQPIFFALQKHHFWCNLGRTSLTLLFSQQGGLLISKKLYTCLVKNKTIKTAKIFQRKTLVLNIYISKPLKAPIQKTLINIKTTKSLYTNSLGF